MSVRLPDFSRRKILVVGDLMLDRYVTGSVDRISPEAPVPVLHVREERDVPGGAANVALLVRTLGAGTAIAGVVGTDTAGDTLLGMLLDEGIDTEGVVRGQGRTTTVKSRVVAQNQQLLRVDRENTEPVSGELTDELVTSIRKRLPDTDAVIISDYGKGVVGGALYEAVRGAAAETGCPVMVDPKIENFLLYRDADLITPNNREAGTGIGIPIADALSLRRAGETIMERLTPRILLITRSEAGMALFLPGEEPVEIPTVAREVYDVTGAGDMVIAAATLGLVSGMSPLEAARLANAAAGLEVARFGCHPVLPGELSDALSG